MTDEIEIGTPDWLPALVLAMANFLAGIAPDMPTGAEAVLTRLVVDACMKGGRQELGKYKREGAPTAERFYEAAPPEAVQSWAGTAKAWRVRAERVLYPKLAESVAQVRWNRDVNIPAMAASALATAALEISIVGQSDGTHKWHPLPNFPSD